MRSRPCPTKQQHYMDQEKLSHLTSRLEKPLRDGAKIVPASRLFPLRRHGFGRVGTDLPPPLIDPVPVLNLELNRSRRSGMKKTRHSPEQIFGKLQGSGSGVGQGKHRWHGVQADRGHRANPLQISPHSPLRYSSPAPETVAPWMVPAGPTGLNYKKLP